MNEIPCDGLPGGTVAVWDIEAPMLRRSRSMRCLRVVLLGDIDIRLLSSDEHYASWLRGAGLDSIQIKRPVATPEQALVTGRENE